MSEDVTNAEKLLALYERVADAPDAIPRLRRFVLDLAIRGKLVEQDPSDEPVSGLLKRIAAEKADQTLRSGNRSADTQAHNLGFPVAATWALVKLSDISLRLHYGYTASAKDSAREVRLLRITDIQDDYVDWTSVPGCEIDATNFSRFALEQGDLLIARTGGTIGKTFLVSEVPVKAVFASYLIRVQPARSLFARYIKLFCGSGIYWTQLRKGSRGGGQPNVNGKTLGSMQVPLPPLAEQHRIVAKVDELMALLDRLEETRTVSETTRDGLTAASLSRLTAPDTTPEAFPAHARFALDTFPALTTRGDQIKSLRQTILNLAVRGQLVEQDPSDEPADALLDRARAAKLAAMKERRIRKDSAPEKSSSAGEPSSPSHWCWAHLYDFALVLGGKRLPAGLKFSDHDTGNIYPRNKHEAGYNFRREFEIHFG